MDTYTCMGTLGDSCGYIWSVRILLSMHMGHVTHTTSESSTCTCWCLSSFSAPTCYFIVPLNVVPLVLKKTSLLSLLQETDI